MNRLAAFLAALVLVCAVQVAAQSLGDVARQNRQKKTPSAHHVVITDEDAPTTNKPVTEADKSAKPASAKSDSAESADSPETENSKSKPSAEQVRNRILAQRRKIRALEEERSDLQERIDQWKGSDCTHVFYPDGTNACDELPQLSAADSRLKSQLAREKTKLEAMQEAGRHLGYGSSVYDPE